MGHDERVSTGVLCSILNIVLVCNALIGYHFSVTSQRYEINILPESIIVGNDAVFKCSIPSFVTDFVSVQSWIDSEAQELGLPGFGTLLVFHALNSHQTSF